MAQFAEQSQNGHRLAIGRRALLKGAAWSVPVIAAATAAPAAVASVNSLSDYSWYFAQNQVGSGGNRLLAASTNINVNKSGSGPNIPFNATIVIGYKVYTDAAKTNLLTTGSSTYVASYTGTHQGTSQQLTWQRQFTPTEWPPNGGPIWVEYTVVSFTATTTGPPPTYTATLGHHNGYGSTNPYTATGYVSSW